MDLDTPHFDAKRRRKDGRNGPNTTEWSSKPARLSVAFLTRAVEKISSIHADRVPTARSTSPILVFGHCFQQPF